MESSFQLKRNEPFFIYSNATYLSIMICNITFCVQSALQTLFMSSLVHNAVHNIQHSSWVVQFSFINSFYVLEKSWAAKSLMLLFSENKPVVLLSHLVFATLCSYLDPRKSITIYDSTQVYPRPEGLATLILNVNFLKYHGKIMKWPIW